MRETRSLRVLLDIGCSSVEGIGESCLLSEGTLESRSPPHAVQLQLPSAATSIAAVPQHLEGEIALCRLLFRFLSIIPGSAHLCYTFCSVQKQPTGSCFFSGQRTRTIVIHQHNLQSQLIPLQHNTSVHIKIVARILLPMYASMHQISCHPVVDCCYLRN